MPFGGSGFESALTALAWGPDPDPQDRAIVQLTSVGLPSLGPAIERSALSLGVQAAGGYPLRPAPGGPLPNRGAGRSLVLDGIGLRHVDVPKGVGRLARTHLSFAVRWAELDRITLELLWSGQGAMRMAQLRTVLVPRDPSGFDLAHPNLAPMHGAANVGSAAWMMSLGMWQSPGLDRAEIDAVLAGYFRYARPVYSGHLDEYVV